MCALTHFWTDSLQTWCNILRVTESCMDYLIFTCALACARYAHTCIHMCACVHSHILGRIRSKIGGNIPLHWLHAFYMRTCVYTLCACVYCTHVRIHTFLEGFFPNLVEYSTGHRKLHGLHDFFVCALLDGFVPNLVETLLIKPALD
jgi:hypothetical protein